MHANNLVSRLGEPQSYPCPVCRCGQISTLPMMEAMACHSCRHIFTVDTERQQIKMADRHPPLMWHWNGKQWTGAQMEGVELGWGYWLGGIAFVVFPTILLGVTAYARPPLAGVPLSWLPTVWTGLAFLLHTAIISWLVIEFYEFPIWAYLKSKLTHS